MSGFTLIELLVVISIIALLSAVVVPNFMGARERGRDVSRKSDVRQIQKAMELYKDTISPPSYPATAEYDAISCDSSWSTAGGELLIKEFPCDPLDDSKYEYELNAADSLVYTLYACLENESDPDGVVEANCTDSGYKYEVTNP